MTSKEIAIYCGRLLCSTCPDTKILTVKILPGKHDGCGSANKEFSDVNHNIRCAVYWTSPRERLYMLSVLRTIISNVRDGYALDSGLVTCSCQIKLPIRTEEDSQRQRIARYYANIK